MAAVFRFRAAIDDETVQDGLSDERAVMLMQEQIDRLVEKAPEIEMLLQYLQVKCQWIQSGKEEPEPSFLCIANDEG